MNQSLEDRIQEILDYLGNGDICDETAILDIREAMEKYSSQHDELKDLLDSGERTNQRSGTVIHVWAEDYREVVE